MLGGYSTIISTYILSVMVSMKVYGLLQFNNNGPIDSLAEKINYHEIIQISRRIYKRGATCSDPSGYKRQEYITFRAFNRVFKLYLTPKKAIFHPSFSSRIMSSTGETLPFDVNLDEHFEGHVQGSKQSKVALTFDEYGTMLGVISVDNETYVFEPARLHDSQRSITDVLAYRDSDLRSEFLLNHTRSCTALYSKHQQASASRGKRSPELARRNRCSLRLVADYSFFRTIGNGSLAFSARYLINVIDRVNVLYTSTNWGLDEHGRSLSNMGFMIKDMIIHNESTLDSPKHYNAFVNEKRNVNELLEDFSYRQGSKVFCLVHLFTAQPFQNSVLGLGYISSPEQHFPGGICSPASRTILGMVYYNSAISNAKASSGGTVITREADIVTAHELGHNWGATHDDSSLECSPPYHEGGSYIMSTYSVSGYDSNNDHFSPCSKRMIGKVLSRKAHLCFEEEISAFCGNSRIEWNSVEETYEECDVGGRLFGVEDRCCTSACRLKSNAQCSPKNFPCCSYDCQFLPNTSICLHENPLQCSHSSYCTGISGECPEPRPIENGKLCAEDGECLNGECLTFCERPSINKKPCICHNEATSCLRCCRSLNGSCEPLGRTAKYILKDGTRCIHGYCRNAICVKKVADYISHLWTIIDSIDETNFWKFVGNNLVGIIAAISLLIWIPASIFITHLDNKYFRRGAQLNENRIKVVQCLFQPPDFANRRNVNRVS